MRLAVNDRARAFKDARRQRIILSQSSVSPLKSGYCSRGFAR
jgi:hypothetical protein